MLVVGYLTHVLRTSPFGGRIRVCSFAFSQSGCKSSECPRLCKCEHHKATSAASILNKCPLAEPFRLGLREVDIVNGLDENLLFSSTIIGKTCHKPRNETCPPTVYRSLSGQCNNVRHAEWGAAFQPFSRFGPVSYADGELSCLHGIIDGYHTS